MSYFLVDQFLEQDDSKYAAEHGFHVFEGGGQSLSDFLNWASNKYGKTQICSHIAGKDHSEHIVILEYWE